MWIRILSYLNIKITSIRAQSNESGIKFINLVWMIANQNFSDICFTYFILRLRLRPTAKGRSFSGPNIRLRPKFKIVPTVQHCKYLKPNPQKRGGNEMSYRVRTPSYIASSVADFHTWFYISLPSLLRFVLSIIFFA